MLIRHQLLFGIFTAKHYAGECTRHPLLVCTRQALVTDDLVSPTDTLGTSALSVTLEPVISLQAGKV